jgi:hypothetical protein
MIYNPIAVSCIGSDFEKQIVRLHPIAFDAINICKTLPLALQILQSPRATHPIKNVTGGNNAL